MKIQVQECRGYDVQQRNAELLLKLEDMKLESMNILRAKANITWRRKGNIRYRLYINKRKNRLWV